MTFTLCSMYMCVFCIQVRILCMFVFLYTDLVVFVATRCFIEKYRSPMVAMIKRPMLQTAGGVAILANFHGHILQRRHVFY